MVYLNHAGTSWPKPPAVLDAVTRALHAAPDGWPDRFAEAHTRVASAFGTEPEWLLPTPGGTSALAAAVAAVPWEAGDRVLTSGLEHEALLGPLAQLAGRGVEVLQILPGAGPIDLARVEAELRRGGVRLVAASMASNVTGEVLPWADLVGLARAHGASSLLDGAQAAGWQPLDLPALGADFFACAGHKGPQAPYGIGLLYRDPAWSIGYCAVGSTDLPGLCGLAEGLAWMAAHRPLEAARAVAQGFREEARSIPGVRVVEAAPGAAGPRMPTCSLSIEGTDPAAVGRALGERGVVVRAGMHCAPRAHATLGTHPAGTVRFSFGPRATADDANLAIRSLRRVLAG